MILLEADCLFDVVAEFLLRKNAALAREWIAQERRVPVAAESWSLCAAAAREPRAGSSGEGEGSGSCSRSCVSSSGKYFRRLCSMLTFLAF